MSCSSCQALALCSSLAGAGTGGEPARPRRSGQMRHQSVGQKSQQAGSAMQRSWIGRTKRSGTRPLLSQCSTCCRTHPPPMAEASFVGLPSNFATARSMGVRVFLVLMLRKLVCRILANLCARKRGKIFCHEEHRGSGSAVPQRAGLDYDPNGRGRRRQERHGEAPAHRTT